VERRELLE
jgi:hypothetical protein